MAKCRQRPDRRGPAEPLDALRLSASAENPRALGADPEIFWRTNSDRPRAIAQQYVRDGLAPKTGETMRKPDQHPLVLVVEDEPLLRLNAAETLQRNGFRLLEAASGGEALRKLRQSAGEVAVAVIDLGLPDLPGEELARQLREIQPALPMVIASGYSHRRVKKLFAGMDGIALLEKPYGTAELTAAVHAFASGSDCAGDATSEPLTRGPDPRAVGRP